MSAFFDERQLLILLSGILFTVALLVTVRAFLPENRRGTVRFPVFCLLCAVLLLIAQSIARTSGFGNMADVCFDIGAVFVMLAIGRLGVLATFDIGIAKRIGHSVPKIVRDVVQGVVYVGVILLALRLAGVQISSLLVTSALFTAVIGLALQETLGNIISGLTLQVQQPFEVGDWIQFNNDERQIGEVIEINWRATKLLTLDRAEVTVPNGLLAKNSLATFTKPTHIARRSVYFAAPYATPPRRVHEAVMAAVKDVPGVVSDPPPTLVTFKFLENATIQYWLRYFITDFSRRDIVDGAVRDRVWYALERADIAYPLPLSGLYFHESDSAEDERLREAEAIEQALKTIHLFEPLDDIERHVLASSMGRRLFAPGEVIVREGEEGEELFIVRAGTVAVTVSGAEVARMSSGNFFGEMSLLTGAARAATVLAVSEVEVYVMGRAVFQRLLSSHPELAEDVSAVLATRQTELEQVKLSREARQQRVAERSSQILTQIRKIFSLG